MGITIDFNSLLELGSLNPFQLMWLFFIKGGWILFAVAVISAWWKIRLLRLQGKYLSGIEYTLLAIDVPKNSEQTPKAMEQVFATLSGAHATITLKDKYVKGEVQLSFSCEIVSIDGYIQFLIHTPKVFRDLAEGAIYAQYPDAEITEVYDYTGDVPTTYPNDQYNVWGSELQLAENEALPLRTYQSFEDILSQELKDPLASLLETMSRIQKGEQVWLQIIVTPTNNDWIKKSLNYAYKLAGKKSSISTKKNWYSFILDWLYSLPDLIPFLRTGESMSNQDTTLDFRVMNLTPGERGTVEAIEKKAAKVGFVCKIRLVYISPHEKYQSKRVISAVFGALKQFGDLSANSLKPNKRTKTQVAYFNVTRRLNFRRGSIVRNYKKRSWFAGSARWFILNAEELATLYHFPLIQTKTPTLKRTDLKKSDSPVELPIFVDEEKTESVDSLREQLAGLELDNDYFEGKYAKTKGSSKKQTQEVKKPVDNIPDNLPLVQ